MNSCISVIRALFVAILFTTACDRGGSREPAPSPGEPSAEPDAEPMMSARAPELQVTDTISLRPSPTMEIALEAFDPSFRPWNLDEYEPWLLRGYQFTPQQMPSRVLGDFNGDGLPDMAIDGRTATDEVLVVLLSQGDRYTVVELARGSLPTDGSIAGNVSGLGGRRRETYLEHLAPQSIVPPIWDPQNPVAQFFADTIRPTFVLTTDAFAVILEEKASWLQFYRNGRFWRLDLGD